MNFKKYLITSLLDKKMHMQVGTFCTRSRGAPATTAGGYDRWSHCNTCNNATPDLLLQHLNENTCNIRPKQLKHLQHTSEILAKHSKTLESHCKRMQHIDKTFETYTCNMHNYATSRYTSVTFRWNTWNICQKQLKHLQHILATCVYSHCNIGSIQMKHLKTYFWNTWKHLKHGVGGGHGLPSVELR
jgi:hypothetical protein